MAHKVIDRRGQDRPKPRCRVCGAPEEHTIEYNAPTMKCIEHLRAKIRELIALLGTTDRDPELAGLDD